MCWWKKPLTGSTAEALELICLAETQGRVLMVGHTFEYNRRSKPSAAHRLRRAGRRLLHQLRPGEPGVVSKPDINVMWDLAPHEHSILNYILDLEPVAVSVRGRVYVRAQTRRCTRWPS